MLLPISWSVNSTDTVSDNLRRNATFAAQALEQWKVNKTGPLVILSDVTTQVGFFRVPDSSKFFEEQGQGGILDGPRRLEA